MNQPRSITDQIIQLLQPGPPRSLTELYSMISDRRPGLAFSTVYRTVRTLEQDRRVVRVDWRERGGKYEWASLPLHHHLTCQQCHSVIDLTDELLLPAISAIETNTGFVVAKQTIALAGLCANCQ